VGVGVGVGVGVSVGVGADMTRLLGPLVSVMQCVVEKTPDGQVSFGTQLLAVIQISVPGATVSVYEFRHGCGAMDSMSPLVDV